MTEQLTLAVGVLLSSPQQLMCTRPEVLPPELVPLVTHEPYPCSDEVVLIGLVVDLAILYRHGGMAAGIWRDRKLTNQAVFCIDNSDILKNVAKRNVVFREC